MPRAELPAIIPLRQFGEDTWLAPGVIKPVGDARVIRAQRETVTARRSLRAGGRKACRRLSPWRVRCAIACACSACR
jgi:hypothetical protein